VTNVDIGMVGLGVMGRNLVLNLEEKGFSASAWDAWPEPVQRFRKETEGKKVSCFEDLEGFVKSLRKPRRIVMLVKAGEVVDKTIQRLLPLLEPGDMLVDAGNEYFQNTERRARELAPQKIRYFGMGVSGGEFGARHGPSMMPGGDKDAWEELKPLLTKIAAQHADGPCVAYMGPGGAGHYVKMVHNGIEYGDMQLIAEAYDAPKTLGGFSNDALGDTFAKWNEGELQSFLIEITARIFKQKDALSPGGGAEGRLIDQILDATGMKGTGKWTVQDASDLSVPVATIASSVEARILSAQRATRLEAAKVLPGPKPSKADGTDAAQLAIDVKNALYASKMVSYAQGLNLLRAASDERKWDLDLGEIARIWQDGCIIRARFLGRIKEAYDRDKKLPNLLLDTYFRGELEARQVGWRRVVSLAAERGLPLPTTMASLGYYDSFRRERLPANLTQAQRDLFGSHTYKRLDREGDFHTEWD
jgi:6-phosphogluconate dehydrogenase